jgi:hypothetical protein
MTQVIVDGVGHITLHNGVVRIECLTIGSDGKSHPSGTLIIPGASARAVLEALVNGMKELEKKLRDQQVAVGQSPKN